MNVEDGQEIIWSFFGDFEEFLIVKYVTQRGEGKLQIYDSIVL